MRSIDDSIEWTVRGDNALSGVHTGKEQAGKLWAECMSTNLTTEPHDFIADGDKVVVLTTVEFEGEQIENADVLTYNGDGMLVAFDTLGDEAVPTGCSPGVEPPPAERPGRSSGSQLILADLCSVVLACHLRTAAAEGPEGLIRCWAR